MTSQKSFFEAREAEKFEGRVIVRRFTDQLTGADQLERSTKAAQMEIDREEETEEERQLKLLYEYPDTSTSPQDFDSAEIARKALQQMIDQFETKPTVLQRMGIPTRPTKAKVKEVLSHSMQSNLEELQETIDNLDDEWKGSHGPAYNAFKTLCGTLNDHKSVFAIFPSQSDYTSVLSASLSCLVKAAVNHSDISEMLSKCMVTISDKVRICSAFITIIKTEGLRKRLSNIYARMFQFYRDAIEWYLSSRASRALRSFNENLKTKFEGAMKDIEECITDFHREAQMGNAAMTAIVCGQVASLKAELRRQRQNYVSQDIVAGRRMLCLLESVMDRKYNQWTFNASKPALKNEPAFEVQDEPPDGITRAQARAYCDVIDRFIVGDEGPGLVSSSHFWVAEDEVLPKLRTWMMEDATSRTLWISSPYDTTGTTSSRASALAVVSAAWQAETPLISHFCQRPRPDKLRAGMTADQIGLIGLVYSLISQLLQFRDKEDQLNTSKESLEALNGERESWAASLEVLQALLDRTPVLMYCVIDGLNDIEMGAGREWCGQFLNVLFTRQQHAGTVFNILFTTTGQSRLLPTRVQLKDRYMTTKMARKVERTGKRIELHPTNHGAPGKEKRESSF